MTPRPGPPRRDSRVRVAVVYGGRSSEHAISCVSAGSILRNLDPEIDLDVVAGEPRPGDYRYAVNNSFGFGGHNVAIAFGKY